MTFPTNFRSLRLSACMAAAFLTGALPLRAAPLGYEQDIRPILEKYCWDCHGDGAKKGSIQLDTDKDAKAIAGNRKLWGAVQFHVEQWTMPPPEEKTMPTKDEREKIVAWLDDTLDPVDAAHPDPGRVTIRRLNRVEYNNTVRDLLGVTSRPADEFPEDDTGYGFDNIGDVLSLPPILMERYLIAADRVLIDAIPAGPPPPEKKTIEAEEFHGVGFPAKDTRLLAFSGMSDASYLAPVEGDYVLRITARQDSAGNEPAKLKVTAGDRELKTVTVTEDDPGKFQVIEVKGTLKKGDNRIGLDFINDFYNPNEANAARRDRNVYIRSMEVDGPYNAKMKTMGETAVRIFGAAGQLGETEAGAKSVLKNFANRAFRRAALDGEVERLLNIFKAVKRDGESWRDSLRIAMKAVLVSPYFLYRIEWQEDAANPAAIVDLSEFALASRLSYWLWSSCPDDELLSLAFRNQLRASLKDQVLRMLKDGKARALAENFGGQWLELRSLASMSPDKERFPGFNEEIRKAMRMETEEFFHYIIKENRPLTELVGADYTFLNDRLAAHYGISGVQGAEFRQVKLDAASHRAGGVLTHGSILTLTSDSTRTSPVKRGKWILENMLGVAAPPPPPNVPPLPDGKQAELTGSVRQRLEQHRSKAGCVSCHSLIDPLGFGLEHFDPTGRWREKDGDHGIDSKGVLTTGQTFTSPAELAGIVLKERSDSYLRNIAGKMLTYSLGRGLTPQDRPAIAAILKRMAAEGNTFNSLVLAITDSVPFQKRRGDPRRQ